VFINGNIGGGKQDESEFENGFEFKSNGISAGADYRFGSTGVLGGAVGVAATNLDLNYDQGGLDARGLSFIGYGSLYPTDNSYIDIIISVNSASFDSERRIVFGATDDFALGSNDSSTLATHLAAGYNLVQSGGFSASLDAMADYAQTTIEGYIETGDSVFNVTIAEHDVSQLTSSLGTTMTYAISSARAVFIPQLDLFWVHQFKEEADIIEGYFNVDPNQTIFRFNSNLPDVDFFKVELGLSAISTAGTTSFVQLGSTVSRSDYQNWHLAVGLRMEL
jgi:uncharacterized protein YhjY with autotransporter beta-barrel domain